MKTGKFLKVHLAVLIIGFVSASTVTLAQSSISAAVDDVTAHQAKAYSLASYLTNEVATAEELEDTTEKEVRRMMESDADILSLDVAYPGLIDKIIDEIVPIAIRQAEASTPQLVKELGDLYAENMTPAELETASTFYRSPTGTKLVKGMLANMDLSFVTNDAMTNSDSDFSAEALEKSMKIGAIKGLKGFSKEELAALMLFSKTDAFKKIDAMGPQSVALQAKWGNASTAAEDAEMETAILTTMAEHMGLDPKDLTGE